MCLPTRNTHNDGRVTVTNNGHFLQMGSDVSQKFRKLIKLLGLCGMYGDTVSKVYQTERKMDRGKKKSLPVLPL